MAKKVKVVRCPECGSTNAGEDGGIVDLTHMACTDCGHSEYADHWQISFDWNVEIMMPDDADEAADLPRFVAPLDPRYSLYVKTEPDPTKPALPAPAKPSASRDES